MIPAAKLWEKTSAKGNRYFVGRMGGVRVLVFENKHPEGENDASHILFFTDAPQRNQSTPDEPSHSAPLHSRARRGGKTEQIEDDLVNF